MSESIQMKLWELKYKFISFCINKINDKLQASNDNEVNKNRKQNIGRKYKVLNEQRQNNL